MDPYISGEKAFFLCPFNVIVTKQSVCYDWSAHTFLVKCVKNVINSAFGFMANTILSCIHRYSQVWATSVSPKCSITTNVALEI